MRPVDEAAAVAPLDEVLERGLALEAERRPFGRATPRLAPVALYSHHP